MSVLMIQHHTFLNAAEMLYAVGRYEPVLHYYKLPIIEGKHTKAMFKGRIIKAYLAHILVCKHCHKYLFDFVVLLDHSVVLLDHSVAHHPYRQHKDIAMDRLNDEGIPIFEYVLDADFDVLRDKAFYSLTDEQMVYICEIVHDFMNTYVTNTSVDGPV